MKGKIMKVVSAVVGICASAVLASGIAFAQTDKIEGSHAFTFPENDNQLIAIQ